jgi:hypothetical protein
MADQDSRDASSQVPSGMLLRLIIIPLGRPPKSSPGGTSVRRSRRKTGRCWVIQRVITR